MSPEVIIGILGAAVGVVAGVFAERLAQRYGRLRFETEPMRIQLLGDQGGRGPIHSLPVDVEAYAANPPVLTLGRIQGQRWVEYKVSIELFNEKELPIGLRDIAIVFRGKSGTCVETMPCYQGTWQIEGGPGIGYGMPKDADPVEVINLPSREWLRFDLAGAVNGEFVIPRSNRTKLKECETIEFVGHYPDRRKYVRTIPIDADWRTHQFSL